MTALSTLATLAVCAAAPTAQAAPAAPAATTTAATTTAVYGFAWQDGPRALRITPAKATRVKQYGVVRYRLTPIPGARERRIGYANAAFQRITAACDLKETEGVVRLDSAGLGTTKCGPADLDFVLGLGPTPVKITLSGASAATRVQEFLAAPTRTTAAYGTIKRADDDTILFTRAGRTIRLHHTHVTFNRVTRRCADPWLANHPNADRDGLGTKPCATAYLTRALKPQRYPVLAKVDYTPASNQLNEVWEVFGDA
ncbi:hypothetical protein HNP84_003532 [Thermocatellispora tengchongensis]|uniref:Uncharacterized protein n=1 Tax=Thermocatellispora tengchongensis TaxID=1073253 RepID=A0A840P5H8_9ACTN|nr:hypothetical protein [Thermocatellispora tengchongensis]MBB5133806.1 hypothetical protein [Thermocatellispora tengchongensis]